MTASTSEVGPGDVLVETSLCWGQQWPWNEQQRAVAERSPSLVGRATFGLGPARGRRGQDLTPERARQVLRDLVERHEALRSTFRADDGGTPRQLVWPADADMFELVVLDRRATRSDFQRAVDAEMDLVHRWPLRLVVHRRLGGTRVGLAVHHVAADLHAFERAVDEVRVLLAAGPGSDPPELPPPGLQPREIAAFEQSAAGAARNDRALRHWLDRRDDLEAVLRTVRDRFDEPAGTMHVARATSGRAPAVLARQAKEHRASPAAVVTAALARVLGEFLGCTTLPMYMLVSNRHHRGMATSMSSAAQAGLVVMDRLDRPDQRSLVGSAAASILTALKRGHYDGEQLAALTQDFVGFATGSPVSLPSVDVAQRVPATGRRVSRARLLVRAVVLQSWVVDRPCRGFNFHVSLTPTAVSVELRAGTHLLSARESVRLVDDAMRLVLADGGRAAPGRAGVR